MIRFVDIGHQIIFDPESPRHFAFFDTVTDKFLTFAGEQVFDSWRDFEESFHLSVKEKETKKEIIVRLAGLCPAWVFCQGYDADSRESCPTNPS
jgi:hypothetical protein